MNWMMLETEAAHLQRSRMKQASAWRQASSARRRSPAPECDAKEKKRAATRGKPNGLVIGLPKRWFPLAGR